MPTISGSSQLCGPSVIGAAEEDEEGHAQLVGGLQARMQPELSSRAE